MTRIPHRRTARHRPPPGPPRDSALRERLLGYAREYAGNLGEQLGTGIAAEAMTFESLQRHWNTHVRPIDHPEMRGNELVLRLAVNGRWERAARAAAEVARTYSRGAMAGADLTITTLHREQPEVVASVANTMTWTMYCHAMATQADPFQPNLYTTPYRLLFPELPLSWTAPTLWMLPLLADTTLRLATVGTNSLPRMHSREEDFLAATVDWLMELQPSVAQLTALGTAYAVGLFSDARQLIHAALGRLLSWPDAFSDAHLRALLELPLIPGALLQLARLDQAPTDPWYRHHQEGLQRVQPHLTPRETAAAHAIGGHLAAAQGDLLRERWHAATRDSSPRWTEADTEGVRRNMRRMIEALGQRDWLTMGDAIDRLMPLPVGDDNRDILRLPQLLGRLLHIWMLERTRTHAATGAPMPAELRNLEPYRQEAMAALDTAWDETIAWVRANVDETQMPARFRLRGGLATFVEVTLATQLRELVATVGGTTASTLLQEPLHALLERRGSMLALNILRLVDTIVPDAMR